MVRGVVLGSWLLLVNVVSGPFCNVVDVGAGGESVAAGCGTGAVFHGEQFALGFALVMASGWPAAVLRTVLGFLRAIPVLMLIFWIYFLLPVVFDVDVPGTVSVVCALSLISGAYLAHGVAAGIHAIPQGQWSAGLALGMTRWEVLRTLILPQALTVMLPSFVNQWVTLIKDSSLAYIVGVGELSFLSSQVNARLMVHPAEVFLFVGGIYWLLCSALNLLAWAVERRARPLHG